MLNTDDNPKSPLLARNFTAHPFSWMCSEWNVTPALRKYMVIIMSVLLGKLRPCVIKWLFWITWLASGRAGT